VNVEKKGSEFGCKYIYIIILKINQVYFKEEKRAKMERLTWNAFVSLRKCAHPTLPIDLDPITICLTF
jgi:hypothetical protein